MGPLVSFQRKVELSRGDLKQLLWLAYNLVCTWPSLIADIEMCDFPSIKHFDNFSYCGPFPSVIFNAAYPYFKATFYLLVICFKQRIPRCCL
uniref:Uncharacterized protein n=1 Tax=Arundo donax TaxID=35708 RepID=A0A0A9GEI6_ARUDO